MSTPCFIQSANAVLTMDISHAVYAEGTPIVGYPPGGGEGAPIKPNQSWQVILDPISGHYLIVSTVSNMCIGIGANSVPQPNATEDVMDDETDRGAVLTLQVQEPINNSYQLWDFLAPTGGTGDSVFIQNPETGYVIELESQSTTPCRLLVNPRRISNDTFQLWTAVNQEGDTVTPGTLPAASMAQRSAPLVGNSQYVLLPPDQGDHLVGITVTIDIIEDVVVEACTIQINCNTPYRGAHIDSFDKNNPTETYDADIEEYDGDTEDFDRQAQWMQFGVYMHNNQLMLFNQFWHRLGPVLPSELTSVTEKSAPFLLLNNNTIPAGTRIIMNICTDQTDFAIGVTGLALDVTGLPMHPPIYWPALGRPTFHATVDGGKVHQKAMAPIGAFQVAFCSLPGASTAQFTSGMGTITITANPGIMAVNHTPNPHGIETAENSNIVYDFVPSGTSRLISQPFGLPTVKVIPPFNGGVVGDSGLDGTIILEMPGGIVEVLHGDAGGPATVYAPISTSPTYTAAGRQEVIVVE